MATDPKKVTITIEQGATFRWLLTITDTLGQPVDLIGCHAVMQIRRTPKAADILLEASTYVQGIVITPATGQIDIKIEDEDTATLTMSEAAYDVLLLWPDGDVSKMRYGRVKILPGVTRSWQTS